MAKVANIQVEVGFTKTAKALLAALTALGALAVSAVGQINSAKMTLTEILGAAGTLTGIGALTGWQYSAIIGGIAVVLAVERNPVATEDEKALAAKTVQLRKALQAAKASGKLEVLTDDVIKAL